MYAVNRFVVLASAVVCLSFSPGTNAEPLSQQPLSSYGYVDERACTRPSAEEMMFDGLIVRPVSLVGTLAGTVVFIATLPFSALSGSAQEAAERLIAEPAQHTFTRRFGCVGTRYPGYWSERHY